MAEFQTQFDTPEDAYYGFFEADKAKNADAWAAVMSYPHVRVAAAGNIDYFNTPREYADAADWTSRAAIGWVRTAGREPTRLHETHNKVHLVGGWTRFDAKNEPILWNRVTYILTRLDGSWGIQARFAVGSYVEPDDETVTEAAAQTAIRHVRQYYQALGNKEADTYTGFCRFPMIKVGIGEVEVIEAKSSIRLGLEGGRINNLDISAAQSGTDGVIVATTADYESGETQQSILVVGKVDDAWRIAGVSTINR